MKTAEKRFAVKENGLVTSIFIEQPEDRSEVGNIYIGRVDSVKPGMNAAFVNIGKDKNGFLQRDQLPAFIHDTSRTKNSRPISHFIRQGDQILVQIKKDEAGTKGPLLSGIIELTSEKIVYMPEGKYIAVSKKIDEKARNQYRKLAEKLQRDHEGFIIRTEAANSSEEEIHQEITALRNQYMDIKTTSHSLKPPALLAEKSRFIEELIREMQRLRSGTIYSNTREGEALFKQNNDWTFQFHYEREDIFAKHRLESELQKAKRQIVWLEDGAYIVINETEAAIVIDVNTGKFTGKQIAADTIIKTNISAAVEIARQLRLRDYGGMILIDFIDMKSFSDKRKVQETLQKALTADPKQIRVVGFTPLGIFELTRKRTKKSLSNTLQIPCSICRGTGKVDSPETTAFRLERELYEIPRGEYEAVLIECDEATMITFAGENRRHLIRIEEFLHIKLFFNIVCSGRHEYYLRQFDTIKNIQAKLANLNC